MKNSNLILSRLNWIHGQLLAAHRGSDGMATATIGREREHFIDLFLSNCIPSIYRFGSGDIVDSQGNKTGQLDIVVERPFYPSLPLVGATRDRLYFMESVGAVIEVKSSLDAQFSQAVETANKVKRLAMLGGSSRGGSPSPVPYHEVPVFLVGYQGWASEDTMFDHATEANSIDFALQLDPPMYWSKYKNHDEQLRKAGGARCMGEFLVDLCNHLNSIISRHNNLRQYFKDDED